MRWTRRLGASLLCLVILLTGCASGDPPSPLHAASASSHAPPPPAATAGTFTNPVLGQGADPYLTVVKGRYYYIQSSSSGSGVSLRSAASLAALESAPEQQIVQVSGKAPCCEYWAPEVHRIGGSWYVYVAADDGTNEHHRSYVFKAPSITGPYTFAGELKLPGNRWAIDSTILDRRGVQYALWSGWPGGTNGEQDIYIAKLASPTRATGAAVRLSRPEHAWETRSGTVGVKVNEAPAVLQHGGKIYVTYSASGCWTPDYALGLLTADADSDPLDPKSWSKSKTPVFSGGAASGEYGTGHNGFFTSPDGKQTWMVYHAVTDENGSCESDREVYAQPVAFGPGGAPQFGKPSGSSARLALPSGDPDQ